MVIPLVAAALLIPMTYSNKQSLLNSKYQANMLIWVMLLVVSINIIFRDFSYIDTGTYTYDFSSMTSYTLKETFLYNSTNEPLFVIVSWIVAHFTENPRIYLAVLWVVFIVPFYLSLNRMYKPWQVAVIIFSYLNFGFFYSYSSNVLRQGISIAFIILSLSYYLMGQKNKKPYVFLTVGCLFHWTGISAAVAVILLIKTNIKLRYLLGFWMLSALLYVTNLNAKLVAPFAGIIPKFDVYSSTSALQAYSNQTNRLDFLLFSAVWVAIGIVLYYFFYREDEYLRIIKAYIVLNSLFVLCGFLAFSDRIAAYSWFLIPLLIWHPIVKAKKYSWIMAAVVMILFLVVGFYTDTIKYLDPYKLFS
ncbi:hypothetical protein PAECIP111892_01757 [Paenibacillus auburnensis]|uniref:EpsG family protein n=1 Tax=Paenibacillus auburnensis TaxID=2905649 RepID=A0ABN8FXV2_9BACL|nr:EpsG family protein [Paenibacillus auburnensis]CAH1194597.1 hypothetical protein PAECIP111892_01757 [Paenibacillus auburnensis]